MFLRWVKLSKQVPDGGFNCQEKKTKNLWKKVQWCALCLVLIDARCLPRKIKKEHTRLTLHAQRWTMREKKANRKSRCGEMLADMPTPLPSCGPICGLVELKGCRLWRQQLAAFVLAELTGSRAVKLLQGMWFRLDRHQFFLSFFFRLFSPTVGTLQAVWLGCTVKWSSPQPLRS